MPRTARRKSGTGMYHVVARGIGQQKIFHGDGDYLRYLELLKRTKEKSGCLIFGYCLMANHVHLLIKENEEDIGQVMKRLGTSYAKWHNWKHERFGHVFQDRYKSECIEDDKYLMAVIRYIHNNPVKAGIVTQPEKYKWSSCSNYYGGYTPFAGLIDIDFIRGFFSSDNREAAEKFRQFMEEKDDHLYLEYEWVKKVTDEEISATISGLLEGRSINTLKQLKKAERDEIIKQVKGIEGTRLRQISKITGLGYSIIARAGDVS